MRREATSIEQVLAFECREQRHPRDVSSLHVGYDVESHDDANAEIRRIEVKSPSYVQLTPKEYKVAKEAEGFYYLYVVDGDNLHIVRDPANRCEPREIEVIETRWEIAGWKEAADRHKL